ncbi:TRAP transporter large permease [Castellaniella denitrificans]|uniref:TRAP transporter large permease protein n=1 Tax=Castellaniella denitrificans TaxID=56119 RepID=A0ABT4M8R0_9BURK|nr:TRAP transporter large permease [Castellaniella denitrificans]MCZ4330506.1 TRAP transporter large permease [Castellaniella denitrificans]
MIDFGSAAIGFLIMLGLMLTGISIAASLFLTASLGALLYLGLPTLMSFGNTMWGVLNDFILTCIPLFILLGEILVRAGVTDRMYRTLSDWLAPLPGGLLHSNIGACSIFAAISGSSVATAATMGTVALPAMQARRYNERLVLGTVAAGGTLGILIPPSINMIVYGAITNTSIGKLFIAGIVPGLLLAGLFMVLIMVMCVLKPSLAGDKEQLPPLRERLRNLVGFIPPGLVFFIVMGGIYLGWATPTEAAALGVVMSMLIAAWYRKLTVRMLHEAFLSTMRTTAMVLLIIIGAFFLNYVIGMLGVPQAVSSYVAALGTSPLETLWILVIFYLILGSFLETLSMMIATVPVIVPLVVSLGYDPVWFGIFLVLMMELSLITPPVGMNLYVVQGIRGKGSVIDVIRGSMPFVLIMLLMTALIIFFPDIVLWLPGKIA